MNPPVNARHAPVAFLGSFARWNAATGRVSGQPRRVNPSGGRVPPWALFALLALPLAAAEPPVRFTGTLDVVDVTGDAVTLSIE